MEMIDLTGVNLSIILSRSLLWGRCAAAEIFPGCFGIGNIVILDLIQHACTRTQHLDSPSCCLCYFSNHQVHFAHVDFHHLKRPSTSNSRYLKPNFSGQDPDSQKSRRLTRKIHHFPRARGLHLRFTFEPRLATPRQELSPLGRR